MLAELQNMFKNFMLHLFFFFFWIPAPSFNGHSCGVSIQLWARLLDGKKIGFWINWSETMYLALYMCLDSIYSAFE